MAPRFVLHGSYDAETERACNILDVFGHPYRVERVPKEDYDGQVVLCTSGGRFFGLRQIEWMFGKNEPLEAQVQPD